MPKESRIKKAKCAVCGQPVELTPKALTKHMEGHGEASQRILLMKILLLFCSQVDKDIKAWEAYPAEIIRSAAESGVARECLSTAGQVELSVDMLILRVQCAEEFQRVAREYVELIRLRLKVEAGRTKEKED